MVILREYQIDGIRKIFYLWDPKGPNVKNVLLQLPTGTGKTTLFSEIVRKAQLKNKFVLIVVHRIELVEQIAERLQSFCVSVGIISAEKNAEPDKAVQVATIQTLSRRNYPPADIVIIDECHHSKAATYRKLWEIYPDARFLGVTATPVRLNGEGFDDLFQALVSLGQLNYFIKEGYLAKIKHLVGGIPDLSKVKIRMRDYDLPMLKNVMMDNTIMANLVESYLKYAKGKKAIIFAVDIEHSKSIVERYLAVGIPAAHLDANTPKNGRKNILEKFKNGEILVLSNVDIVSEGFDVPDCEVVQLARPTKSLALFLQQAGRCGRPAPNKQFGIILDNAGLWLEHGIAYIDRDWSLEGVNKSKHKESPRKMIGFDEEDRIREIHWPVEAEGLELVEVNDDLERLLIFESYIRVAKLHEHKLVSVVYKYCDYLLSQKTNFTDYEMKYCHKRLNKEGCNYKIGFWYYRKIELSEKLKQDEYSRKLTAKPRF